MRFLSRKFRRLAIVLVLGLAGAISAWTDPIGAGDPPSAATSGYRLVKVFDGDSMLLRNPEGAVIQVRIAGIDAPEKSQPYADDARDRLSSLLERDSLVVAIHKKDVYGRWLASVWVDGKDIGVTLIDEGLVWFFRRYQSDLSREQRQAYDAAEIAAQASRRGLWKEPTPLAPWEFRQNKRERGSAKTPRPSP
jgi:endonuclease YncB( thermonuclease family)